MEYGIRVDDEHFAYLKLQKGRLDTIATDRAAWHRAYEADLRATYEAIAPHLPETCGSMLDVGSGLGGIDTLIRRHYEERCGMPFVSLLDGVDDPPVMTLHRHTFNDMRIARNFQVKNGLSPLKFWAYGPDVTEFESGPFDLVTSFGSWCFHYPPAVYLPQVAAALKPSTVVILDVRSNKPDWYAELERFLELRTCVTLRPKWTRCVFRVKSPA